MFENFIGVWELSLAIWKMLFWAFCFLALNGLMLMIIVSAAEALKKLFGGYQ